MLLEALFVTGAAVFTSLAGVPVAVRLARANLSDFGGRGAPAQQRERRDAVVTAGFTPLDLGPDTIQWPSQQKWPTSRIAAAEWPSKSWNDEHFGRQWRDGTGQDVVDAGFHAMAHRNAGATEADAPRPAKAQRPSKPPPARSAEEAFFEPAPAPRPQRAPDPGARQAAEQRRQQQIKQEQQRQRQEAAARQQEAIRQQAARQAQAQAQAQAQQRRATPPQAPARPQPVGGGNGPPTRDEIERLVASEGLAGTVQHIMRRTGWDFRKAAQYLARTRAG